MAARKANPRPAGARGGTSAPARKAALRRAGAPAPVPRHGEADFPPLTAEAARARGLA